MKPTQFTISAGPHARRGGLARLPWPEGDAPAALSVGGEVVAAQRDGGALAFIAPPMEAGAERMIAASGEAPPEGGAVALEDDGCAIRVTLGGEEFTTYCYGDVPARPYFWPVLAPGGVPVTRAWPMEPDAGPPDARDHPHHRSLYVAFGAVNGVDNWSEEAGHGFTRHRSVDVMESGPVLGRFATTSDWTDAEGRPLLEQRLTVTVWGAAGASSELPLPSGTVGSIGFELVTRGVLTEEEYRRLIHTARERGVSLGQYLLDAGLASERDIFAARAQELGLPFVDLDRHSPDADAIQMAPARVAAGHNVMPVKLDRNTQTLYVAMADVMDAAAMDALRLAARCTIRGVLAGPNSIRRAIRRAYGVAGSVRVMDVDLRLTAAPNSPHVRFGDTKEGGLLTVRVAGDMAVSRGAGGRITNSYGGVNEADAWGRAAHWCDYSGIVGGKPVGIAVMDHPDSFRHPTYWHVRDYGLMAANPFGLSDFTGGAKEGSYLLPVGATLRFVYRVLVHAGTAEDADMAGRYLDYVAPAVLKDEG